jgi:hypothetical protein
MTWVLVALFGGGITATIAAPHVGDTGDKNDTARAVPAGPAMPPPGGDKKRIELDPELATALYRVGLQPENLTAGGVTVELVDDVVIGVKTWVAQSLADLTQADEAYFLTISNRNRLIRLVRSGLATPEEIVACQQAIADFDAADAARKALLDQVFSAGSAALTQEVIAALARVRVNQAVWNVPLEYLVVDRRQEEWVRVRSALANERISAKYGEAPDADDQTYLATARSDATVAAAKANLDTNLGAVRAAWEQAAARE